MALKMLTELFSILRSKFDLSALEEVSLEVNPGGITEEHLSTWKSLGINRLSVGVQILDDQVLANLNRMQTNNDVYDIALYNAIKDFPGLFVVAAGNKSFNHDDGVDAHKSYPDGFTGGFKFDMGLGLGAGFYS